MKKDKYEIVDNVEGLQKALAEVKEAQRIFSTYTQEQVDKIFLAAASAANKMRNSSGQNGSGRNRYGHSRR